MHNTEQQESTPFPESENAQLGYTPFPPVAPPQAEAIALQEDVPDFIPDPEWMRPKEAPTLDGLTEKYSQHITHSLPNLDLTGKTKEVLQRTVDFAKEYKYKLAIPALVAPIIIQQLAEGYSLPVALVKGLDELMRGDAISHMDPEQAKEIVRTLSHAEFGEFAKIAVEQLVDILDDYRVGVHEVIIFAGVLKFLEHIKNSQKETQESIEKGTAKVRPHGEQLFVIGGSGGSYVSEALKKDNPKGVTTIYENDSGGSSMASLLPKEADRLHPLYLNLGLSEDHPTYSGAPGWSLLELERRNLIHTKDGRDVLCVVGIDTANEDEWLGIPKEEHDLTLDEHYTSVLKLQSKIEEKLHSKKEEVCSIWVGSGDRKEVDEETGERTATHREIALQNGIDIYIDTWSVIVKSIEKELQQDIDRKLCPFPCGVRLISDMEEYHDRFDEVADALSLPLVRKDEDAENKATLIVYEETSDKTLHNAQRKMRQFPDRQVIAITSNIEAHRNALQQGIQSICLAQVLANEIKTVRSEIKNGKSYEEIQHRLDTAYPLRPPVTTPAVEPALS